MYGPKRNTLLGIHQPKAIHFCVKPQADKKDIHISLLSVPSPARVMYGWSVWIWVTGWVWKQVEAEAVIQSKLVSDTIISSQNGHLHHYPVTSGTLYGWNTAHICLKWPEVTHRLIAVLDNESYYTSR